MVTAPSGDGPKRFQMINPASGIPLDAGQTLISGPNGNPLLRVIVLSERPVPASR